MLISFFCRSEDVHVLPNIFGVDPNKLTRIPVPLGELLVFFPTFESGNVECCFLLEVKPERLPKEASYLGSGHPLKAFVHDRVYTTSSITGCVLSQAFPKLQMGIAEADISPSFELQITLNGVKCNRDHTILSAWFSPLGYTLELQEVADSIQNGSSTTDIQLTCSLPIPLVFQHLQALLAAMDEDHVHWIGREASVAIANAAQPWLSVHPSGKEITSSILSIPNNIRRNLRDNLVEANDQFPIRQSIPLYRSEIESAEIAAVLEKVLLKNEMKSVLILQPEDKNLVSSLCKSEHILKVSLIDLFADHLQQIATAVQAFGLPPALLRKIQLQAGSPIYHNEAFRDFEAVILEGSLTKLPSHQWPALASTVFAHSHPKIVLVVEQMGNPLKTWAEKVAKEFAFEVEFLMPKLTDSPKAAPMAIAIFNPQQNK
jgi:hypothetical protein